MAIITNSLDSHFDNCVSYNCHNESLDFAQTFVKHELKGVLKCIEVEILDRPPPPTVTDILNRITDHVRHRDATNLRKDLGLGLSLLVGFGYRFGFGDLDL